MANTIKICCVTLFLTVWLTEAYSGKRSKRHYEHNEDKNDFQVKDNSVHTNYRKSRSLYILPENDHLYNENNDYVKNTQADEDVNVNALKRSVKQTDNIERSYTTEENSWVDLVINGAKLAQPYFPEDIRKINLNWHQVEVALRSLESFGQSYEVGARSINMSPMLSTVRAVAAAAEPMIMDYVRMGLGMLLEAIDNTAFMTTGHAISRRGLTDSVLDDIMDAFKAIMEHMADDEDQ